MEEWKDIKGYEGYYQVSNLGNVRSLDRKVGNAWGNGFKKIKGREVKGGLMTSGYRFVCLCKEGANKNHGVHQLVFYTFNEEEKERYYVVDHIDNNKLNNNLDNLQKITYRENCSKDKKGFTSKYPGVQLTPYNRWRATIKIKGRTVYLGHFETELEAKEAYDNKLKEITT